MPWHPIWQGSWGQHGPNLGPVGPRWAPWWPINLVIRDQYKFCRTSRTNKYPRRHISVMITTHQVVFFILCAILLFSHTFFWWVCNWSMWKYVSVFQSGNYLTNWGRVTHICVGNLTIIDSDNGLSPRRRQAIIWTNVGILLIGPLGTNFSEL